MKPLISAATPLWKVNVLVFGFFILLAQAHFHYQSRQVEAAFQDNVRQHATLLSEVVRLNARGAVFSEQVVQDILQTFLLNVSHFIDYLDSIKAFGPRELTALSKELGVAGIRITTLEGTVREGPAGWLKSNPPPRDMLANTIIPQEDRFYFLYSRFQNGNILTSLESARFQELRRKMGLTELFRSITGVAGIRYVHMEELAPVLTDNAHGLGQVRILDQPGGRVAETRLALGEGTMVIGMGCELYDGWLKQNQGSQVIFSLLIFGAGAVCSLLLYAFQRAHLARVREFDQALAREREDATLGRATATITHEIRNPLNAISMGLQRLSLEVENLDPDHRDLIRDLLSSVKRTDHIIADLRRFIGPLEIQPVGVCLDQLLASSLNLYESRIRSQGIEVLGFPETGAGRAPVNAMADADQCAMVVDNLIKNAVEAQEEGGFIRVSFFTSSQRGQSFAGFCLANGGFMGDPGAPERLLEPYVTTKTRGSGLGLAIVRRIVTAHGGQLEIRAPGDQTLEIRVGFPAAQPPSHGKDEK
ncbi:MAG: ATP-binding protein [Desulfobacterales bacterium]|nr:ATP-binding protein [Desulfobacterales bacterium]